MNVVGWILVVLYGLCAQTQNLKKETRAETGLFNKETTSNNVDPSWRETEKTSENFEETSTDQGTINTTNTTELADTSDPTKVKGVQTSTEEINLNVLEAEATDPTTETDQTSLATPLSNTCDPVPEIVNITVVPDSYNATVGWDPPDCPIDGYIVNLNNTEYDTQDTSLVLTDLDACEEYYVGVAGYVGEIKGNIKEEIFKTKSVSTFEEKVEVFNVTLISNNTLNLSWEPPIKVAKCITNYFIIWWGNVGGVTGDFTVQAPNTSKEISPIIGCFTYTFQITPRVNSNEGHLTQKNYSAGPISPNPPELVSKGSGKTNAWYWWKTDDQYTNVCTLIRITLRCEASPDNKNHTWIVQNKTDNLEIKTPNTSFRYNTTIDGLSPWTNYTCTAITTTEAGESKEAVDDIQTLKDVPTAPQDVKIMDIGANSFKITWTEPYKIPGVMEKYIVTIKPIKSENCKTFTSEFVHDVSYPNTSLDFSKALPYYTYNVSVVAVDDAGEGPEATAEATSEHAEPDQVTDLTTRFNYAKTENYSGIVTISFDAPCNMSGIFHHFQVDFTGKRNEYSEDVGSKNTTDTSVDVEMQPDRDYNITITVYTEQSHSSPGLITFHSNPGIPIVSNKDLTNPTTFESNKAKFNMSKRLFGNENGDIQYYALFIWTGNLSQGPKFGFWNINETWPPPPGNAKQITVEFWNPFTDSSDIEFIIGDNKTTENGELKDNTEYHLIVRALTNLTYRDSESLSFKTGPLRDLNLGLILGLTFGLLALVLLLIFLFILWRRRQKPDIVDVDKKISVATPEPIPCKKFLTYYETLKENYNLLKSQYTTLGLQGKEVAGTTSYAVLAENIRKNRYTNILPYDETRVKLKIDEDEEIGSDYVNASYIKGYSGKIEYIATQGPLLSTTKDFWKMVLQENVTIIVMASQFVEQSKEKCFQYFPNNHETINFDDIEVKCSTELHFGTYCIRTLKITKDTEQRNLVHMQFLEWPDFGVPQGTDNMLQFCKQLREKAIAEGGLIVVHCSAGVGRTGTLISLDILLQTIDDHRDINIYKTVFDLRKQRVNMVQTEKQYMFIHTCVRDYIELPQYIETNDSKEDQIYENMEIIRSSLKKNQMETELESAL